LVVGETIKKSVSNKKQFSLGNVRIAEAAAWAVAHTLQVTRRVIFLTLCLTVILSNTFYETCLCAFCKKNILFCCSIK
jgi:hypothetical protein